MKLTKTDKSYIDGLLSNYKESKKQIAQIRQLRDKSVSRFNRTKFAFRDILSGKIQAYDEVLTILGYHESQYAK